jgi:putative alpha-1,2-mannosidase
MDASAQQNDVLTRVNPMIGTANGGTGDERTVFTTALYHSLMTPNIYSDVNGEYRGMDGKVHRVATGQHAQYANFSGWDVYRSQLQLVTWLDPQIGSDIAQSLLSQAEQNDGAWDRWTHNSGATHV